MYLRHESWQEHALADIVHEIRRRSFVLILLDTSLHLMSNTRQDKWFEHP